MSENLSRNLLDKYLDLSWWRHEVSGWTCSSPYHTLNRGLWRSPLHSVECYTNSLYRAFVNICIDTIAQTFLYTWQLLQKVKLAYKEHSIMFIYFFLFFLNLVCCVTRISQSLILVNVFPSYTKPHTITSQLFMIPGTKQAIQIAILCAADIYLITWSCELIQGLYGS